MSPTIRLAGLTPFGTGLDRPETVLVLADGRVLVSDSSDAALSELGPDGSVRRLGRHAGESNGLTMLDEHTVVFTVFDTGEICSIDLRTEEVTVLADRVDGRKLTSPNYPLAMADGTIWVSRTTAADNPLESIDNILHDGSILRLEPGGELSTAASAIPFANCMTVSPDKRLLYVVRTTLSDVARYAIEPDKTLRFERRYGPVLGHRRPDEIGPGTAHMSFDPVIGRRWALADGCAFDAEGNLWVTLTTANKIVAITPQEEVVTVVEDPTGDRVVAPTSIAFGGEDFRDVYIGSLVTPYVLKARSSIPGQPLWHQTMGWRLSESF